MKKKKLLIFFIVNIFLLFVSLFCFIYHKINTVSLTVNSQLPPNFDELIRQEYGKSEYAVVRGNIRIDIEKFDIIRYFIKYSWVTDDQSSFDILINIETLDKSDLEGEAYCVLEYDGEKISPYYQELRDYPYNENESLNYKKQLYARFDPFFKKNISNFNVHVYFGEDEYVLQDIPLIFILN